MKPDKATVYEVFQREKRYVVPLAWTVPSYINQPAKVRGSDSTISGQLG